MHKMFNLQTQMSPTFLCVFNQPLCHWKKLRWSVSSWRSLHFCLHCHKNHLQTAEAKDFKISLSARKKGKSGKKICGKFVVTLNVSAFKKETTSGEDFSADRHENEWNNSAKIWVIKSAAVQKTHQNSINFSPFDACRRWSWRHISSHYHKKKSPLQCEAAAV